ncbi:LLM class flavin-dependent oxidoreductase [Fulvimarina sp. 2208YS6-2-32]|uniref:LLM class flavin-dependent oxidoreductase n=1 Tax=Fulvimarina uroteuthidis TaxID=3098149 RepID=A0ABU5HXT3_9HYPH|nr:LLM class flavin-dependent oxidoreductase [Fulvimarina sp. 2208YS6-2-32]MDY8107954.1 LLM class flavin-dependent oxidoreductase [Fulvimarina sp. 2208YS6-2-32]
MTIPYSVLDLSPIPEGSDAARALANSADLAAHAEALGYTRYWMAEHHNMSGIASAATAVALGFVASRTKTIRIGSGGVMLPNHSPLMVAEAFGTLATLYPNRVDLGVGRAPGTDQTTAMALRRNMSAGDTFPQDVMELIGYFASGEGAPNKVRAIPGEGTEVPVYILGSSLYGAQLAAYLGLPYAFASHFAPGALDQAVEIYRSTFRPSERFPEPYFILAANVFGAATDEEGRFLMSSMQQAFANLRSGNPGKLPRPIEDFAGTAHPGVKAGVDEALRISAVGSPDTVRSSLEALARRYRPDEMILTSQIHDHAARKTSYVIAAEAMREIGEMGRQAA